MTLTKIWLTDSLFLTSRFLGLCRARSRLSRTSKPTRTLVLQLSCNLTPFPSDCCISVVLDANTGKEVSRRISEETLVRDDSNPETGVEITEDFINSDQWSGQQEMTPDDKYLEIFLPYNNPATIVGKVQKANDRYVLKVLTFCLTKWQVGTGSSKQKRQRIKRQLFVLQWQTWRPRSLWSLHNQPRTHGNCSHSFVRSFCWAFPFGGRAIVLETQKQQANLSEFMNVHEINPGRDAFWL